MKKWLHFGKGPDSGCMLNFQNVPGGGLCATSPF